MEDIALKLVETFTASTAFSAFLAKSFLGKEKLKKEYTFFCLATGISVVLFFFSLIFWIWS